MILKSRGISIEIFGYSENLKTYFYDYPTEKSAVLEKYNMSIDVCEQHEVSHLWI